MNTVQAFADKAASNSLKNVDQQQLMTFLSHIPQTPECKYRSAEVTHRVIPAGEHIPVVSMRNAILMGQRPTNVTFDRPYIVRTLRHKRHGVWMTDLPQEVWQMREPITQCHGHVLVGGLGLGVFPWLLTQHNRHKIDSITVIENDPSVIRLIQPHIKHPKITIKQADLFAFVKQRKIMQYDSAFLDTWQMTGEWTWANCVVPLRRSIGTRIQTVLCWNEDEMIGQLDYLAKVARLARPSDLYREVFRRYCQENGLIKQDELIHTQEEYVQEFFSTPSPKVAAELAGFLHSVGTEAWERRFGKLWDELVTKKG